MIHVLVEAGKNTKTVMEEIRDLIPSMRVIN